MTTVEDIRAAFVALHDAWQDPTWRTDGHMTAAIGEATDALLAVCREWEREHGTGFMVVSHPEHGTMIIQEFQGGSEHSDTWADDLWRHTASYDDLVIITLESQSLALTELRAAQADLDAAPDRQHQESILDLWRKVGAGKASREEAYAWYEYLHQVTTRHVEPGQLWREKITRRIVRVINPSNQYGDVVFVYLHDGSRDQAVHESFVRGFEHTPEATGDVRALALEEVANAQKHVDEHEDDLDRRDEAIRKALAQKVPVRDIVAVTGLARQRVYQIRDGHR